MFGQTLWLTLATLLGLACGFAREWLLIADWGAGTQSDAFLVALFLPEALRMTMAGGLLASAALPLYLKRAEPQRQIWLAGMVPKLLICSLIVAGVLLIGAPLWVRLIGPGLGSDAIEQASMNLRILALCVPGFIIHALFSVPLHARERFLLAGLGSLLFNLPPVIYLFFAGSGAASQPLAFYCVLGSILMALSLAPAAWKQGWRPWHMVGEKGAGRELVDKIGPLLSSNLASQGLALLERLVASLLGEGAITWVNLARKLINLPLIALMSLNQVLLGLMSAQQGHERKDLLLAGIKTTTLLCLPASIGLIATSPALANLLLPEESSHGPLPELLAWFAIPLVFGAWNALLARYAYADGDTGLPLRCELTGGAVNAALLLLLPLGTGLNGIPLAALGGVIITGILLMRRLDLLTPLPWITHWSLSILLMGLATLAPVTQNDFWTQLAMGATASGITFLLLAIWLQPWRKDAGYLGRKQC